MGVRFSLPALLKQNRPSVVEGRFCFWEFIALTEHYQQRSSCAQLIVGWNFLWYNRAMKGDWIFFDKINIFRECREYNLDLWECPSFIFFVMGMANMVTMIGTYLIANRFTEEPEIVALIVIAVTGFFFVISHSVTKGFDRLAQANKMKTEFVGIASHQLRSPLSAIRWTLNLLFDGKVKEPAELQNYLVLIKESNERMIRLINDLLDVSRIDMGRLVFSPQQTNFYILAENIIKGSEIFARANNVTLILEAAETLPNVWADTKRISLAFQNLIDNAIKYTKNKGEVRVTIAAKGKFVQTDVSDQGVGIPPDQQKYIFKKFFRSDNAMKHQTVGTGLGLFIASSIIEGSQGKIWFDSQEGQGTNFHFTLPIYK